MTTGPLCTGPPLSTRTRHLVATEHSTYPLPSPPLRVPHGGRCDPAPRPLPRWPLGTGPAEPRDGQSPHLVPRHRGGDTGRVPGGPRLRRVASGVALLHPAVHRSPPVQRRPGGHIRSPGCRRSCGDGDRSIGPPRGGPLRGIAHLADVDALRRGRSELDAVLRSRRPSGCPDLDPAEGRTAPGEILHAMGVRMLTTSSF